MDAYRLHPCALIAGTSPYLHACHRQAERICTSLVSTIKKLELDGTI